MFQGYFLVEVMFQGYFFNCNRSVFKNWPPRPIIGQLKRINNDFNYDFTVEEMRQPMSGTRKCSFIRGHSQIMSLQKSTPKGKSLFWYFGRNFNLWCSKQLFCIFPAQLLCLHPLIGHLTILHFAFSTDHSAVSAWSVLTTDHSAVSAWSVLTLWCL